MAVRCPWAGAFSGSQHFTGGNMDIPQHYWTLHNTALHCIINCTAINNALHYTALHCTALHCTAMHCTALHLIRLRCTALNCPILHFTACVGQEYTKFKWCYGSVATGPPPTSSLLIAQYQGQNHRIGLLKCFVKNCIIQYRYFKYILL